MPFTYDSKRNCFWQIGGFQWEHHGRAVGRDTKGARRVSLRSGPEPGFGEWTQVSAVDVPGSASEGMSAFYYPRLDIIIGFYADRAWWYGCADDSRGTVVVPMADGRDVSGYCAPGYDASKDELLFVTPANRKVVAAKLTTWPTVTTRVVADLPYGPGSQLHPDWSQWGQMPSLFVPSRRTLALGYIDKWILVNVDTGVVTDGPAQDPAGYYINEAIYSPDLDAIVGTHKDSNKVSFLKWTGATVLPATLPSGIVTAVGTNLLRDIDPDPSNKAVYYGKGGFANIIAAWVAAPARRTQRTRLDPDP